ncbi:hypothetical protein [Ensifer sp. SL37]|uniref:hypothetical protein n=1 Tax=Ensifer sp. SL37 TaxID=2995137 RepID=UPI002276218F|nr:hypothetical protein [Ensifer sp. SL37]MCY1744551.1 hypothetical protein [Ensifer sp. SL37]
MAYYSGARPAKAFTFTKYKQHDVTSTLRKLFWNKCAYCESDLVDSLDVEHFRPKGEVTDDPDHPGYWWLALKWENLLPACVGCNQQRHQHLVTEATTEEEYASFQTKCATELHGKGNHFPIDGIRAYQASDILSDEQHRILDPTVDDPEQFLKWSSGSAYSLLFPAGSNGSDCDRALSTIAVYALNRFRLVQSRTGILAELRTHAALITEELEEDFALAGQSSLPVRRALRRVTALRMYCAPDRPYSAMAKAFIDEFAKQIAARVAENEAAATQEPADDPVA